jgi:DNA-binding response OmpR family regulator
VRILIIEDDAAMARGLAERLKLSGFAVDIESDGAAAAQIALLEPYSLVILDINLPNVSGFDVLHRIRQAGSTVPVMILTARYAVGDKVSGLDLGADDYLSKPFDIAEFDARVRALVRRGQGLPNPTLICGPLAFDRAVGTITLNGEPLELRRLEFAVLEVLMTRAGKLVSKERLIAEVFGFDEPVGPNAAELYVARVRQKLGPDGPATALGLPPPATILGSPWKIKKPTILPVTKASAILKPYSIASRHSIQGPGIIGTLSFNPVTVSRGWQTLR